MPNKVERTSQYMDNMSFDESLGVNMVEIIGADGVLQNMAGMNIPAYDYVDLTWTSGNPTTIVFKTGGSTGTTVATLTLTWDADNNPLTITRT